jgi:hypothetical protein
MLDNRLDARFREGYPQFRQMPAAVELPILRQTAPNIETVPPQALKNEKLLKTQLIQFSLISAARQQDLKNAVNDALVFE